jgi:hypothetical protein
MGVKLGRKSGKYKQKSLPLESVAGEIFVTKRGSKRLQAQPAKRGSE